MEMGKQPDPEFESSHGPRDTPAASAAVSISPSLLLRARGQDPEAWRRLTYLYLPVVLEWARRAGLRPEDAEDVGQEVFRTVALKLADFRRDRPGDTFRGWLWTIAQSKLRDHWRRRKARGNVAAAGGTDAQIQLAQFPFEEEPADSADPAAAAAAARGTPGAEESRGLYRRGLELIRAEFAERTWQAFWKVTVDERPVADVAAELGMSPGAVYVAKSRVLRRLRDELADVLGDAGEKAGG
jgi:RNA polymerase sigma-70 factor (ECF subfamily)